MSTGITLLEKYIGISAAARLMGVSEPTARAWADRGLIRSIRDPSGRRLLLREDVLAAVRRRVARGRHASTPADDVPVRLAAKERNGG